MTPRERFSLTFGRGLDRLTGVTAVEPSTFIDLRNVHLSRGKAELRSGLKESRPFDGYDAVLDVHPIRSQDISAVITYHSSDRTVSLWLMTNDGTLSQLVGTIWTLPVGVFFPRVIVDDSFDKLFIAHDEVYFDQRQTTYVYNPQAGTLSPLLADLDRDGTLAPVKFRGVRAYLQYIVGWGYGSEAPHEGDRGEIVRVSLPGEPTVFNPEHYFIAGQRGEPVLACDATGDRLAVRKATQSYAIIGYDRATFGIVPLDPEYGCIAGRLSVTVAGRNYFWSLEGPRVSDGGISADLALPLALTSNAAVSPKVNETDRAYGFALYLPDYREIWFVFGAWAFVLDLSTDQPEWHYNEFETNLVAGGVLYATLGATTETTASPFLYRFEQSVRVDPDTVTMQVIWDTVESLVGDEIAEIWMRPRFGSTGWFKAGEMTPVYPMHAVSPPQNFFEHNVSILGVWWDVAVRYKRGGLVAPPYSPLNPELWPAGSRGFSLSLLPAVHYLVSLKQWRRISTTEVVQHVSLRTSVPDLDAHPELTFSLWHGPESGVGSDVLIYEGRALDDPLEADFLVDPVTDYEKNVPYRLYLHGPHTVQMGVDDSPGIATTMGWPQPSPTSAIGIAPLCLSGTKTNRISWQNMETFDAAVQTEIERRNLDAGTDWETAAIISGTGIPDGILAYHDDIAMHPTQRSQYRVRYQLTWHAHTDVSDWAMSSPAGVSPASPCP